GGRGDKHGTRFLPRLYPVAPLEGSSPSHSGTIIRLVLSLFWRARTLRPQGLRFLRPRRLYFPARTTKKASRTDLGLSSSTLAYNRRVDSEPTSSVKATTTRGFPAHKFLKATSHSPFLLSDSPVPANDVS